MIIFGAKGSLKKDSECIIIPPQDQANSKKKKCHQFDKFETIARILSASQSLALNGYRGGRYVQFGKDIY